MNEHGTEELLSQLFSPTASAPDWDGFLKALSEKLGGAFCGVWCDSRVGMPMALYPVEVEQLLKQYDDPADSPRAYLLEADHPVGQLKSPFEIPARLTDEVLRPLEMAAGAMLSLTSDGTRITANLVIWSPVARPLQPHDLRLLESLAPWLIHAIQVTRTVRRSSARTYALSELIDRLTVGIILLDTDSDVIFANRGAAGLLEGAPGPRFDIQADSPARAARMRSGLDQLFGDGCLEAGSSRKVIVSQLDLPDAAERPFDGRAVTAIIMGLPGVAPVVSEKAIRGRFGLTPAEARLAALLVSDLSLHQAASELKIKVGTARTRLKSIFGKTSTNRQSSLVRRMLTEAALVRGD